MHIITLERELSAKAAQFFLELSNVLVYAQVARDGTCSEYLQHNSENLRSVVKS